MDNYPFTVIAVDFDGTIIKRGDFPKAEHPIPGAVEALKKFMSVGKDKFRFVLWSSRDEKDTKTNCYKQMIEFIEKNGLKFDAINDNIKEYKNDGLHVNSPLELQGLRQETIDNAEYKERYQCV